MKLLAIETSALVCSVAVMEEGVLSGEFTIQQKKTHSQMLMPMVEALCEKLELDLATLDAIAVAGGPGSFTGLRIGSATAKGLASALDKPIVSVPTVDALAYRLCGSAGLICPVMDARREQTYTGIYSFEGSEMQILLPQCAISLPALAAELNRRETAVTFLGDGVPVFREKLDALLTVPHFFAPPHLCKQSAASVAALGMRYLKEGRTETAAMHKPEYLRLSQAERVRAEKMRMENGTGERNPDTKESGASDNADS